MVQDCVHSLSILSDEQRLNDKFLSFSIFIACQLGEMLNKATRSKLRPNFWSRDQDRDQNESLDLNICGRNAA